MRLNLWDFDDTLAASDEVIERMSKAHPEIPYRDWWRDPTLSTLAALETPPLLSMWKTLAKTPGKHVIFSGRAPEAIEAWLDAYRDAPGVAPGAKKLSGLIPVPHFRRPGERIPSVKLRLIREMIRDGERDIHLYDDHRELPYMVAAVPLPGFRLHRVAHGRLLNGQAGCGCGAHGAPT